MATGDIALPTLDPSIELEQMYWHFFVKFQGMRAPRSVAEARIAKGELKILQEWFVRQYERPRIWCERTWQEKVEGEHTASSREMLGALFLILASEVSRDHCSRIDCERFERSHESLGSREVHRALCLGDAREGERDNRRSHHTHCLEKWSFREGLCPPVGRPNGYPKGRLFQSEGTAN
jgi:hypothetical protein